MRSFAWAALQLSSWLRIAKDGRRAKTGPICARIPDHARVIDPVLQETDRRFLTYRVAKLRISAQIGEVRSRVAISAPQRRQKHLQSRPTVEPFGHQVVFLDRPMRSSASNAYKRVATRRFRLSDKNDKAGKYALPRVGCRTQARLARAVGLSEDIGRAHHSVRPLVTLSIPVEVNQDLRLT